MAVVAEWLGLLGLAHAMLGFIEVGAEPASALPLLASARSITNDSLDTTL